MKNKRFFLTLFPTKTAQNPYQSIDEMVFARVFDCNVFIPM